MHLSDRPRAWPDALGNRFLVDLGSNFGELSYRMPFDEAQCHAADILDVARLLSSHHAEVGLQPEALHNDPGRKVAVSIQTLGELEQRRALDHRVIKIKKRCRGGILADQRLLLCDAFLEVL